MFLETEDYTISFNSPLKDAGINTSYDLGFVTNLTEDFQGDAIPINSLYDIGRDEYSDGSVTYCDTVTSPLISYTIGNDTVGRTPATGYINLTTSSVQTLTYLWSNSSTSQDLTNIQAGNYSVQITMTDSGCVFNYGSYTVQDIDTTTPEASVYDSIEVETMTLSGTNYGKQYNVYSSNDTLVFATSDGGNYNATINFSGTSGNYEVKFFYFDENDGVGTWQLQKNNVSFYSWSADQDLGEPTRIDVNRVSVTDTIDINNNDEIKIVAQGVDGDRVGSDLIVFKRLGDIVATEPTRRKVQYVAPSGNIYINNSGNVYIFIRN